MVGVNVNVNVGGMYEEESRGNRLLSPDNQRLVLIGHKAPPPMFRKDGQPKDAGATSSTRPSASTSGFAGKGGGKSFGKGCMQVHSTATLGLCCRSSYRCRRS